MSASGLLLAPVSAAALSTTSTNAVQPPTLSESFPSTWVANGGTIAMSFTLSNPNQATGFTATSFSDTLPPGLALANPADAGGTCLSTGEGIVSGSPGGRQFGLSGASLASGSSCTLTIDVIGTVSGFHTNTTGVPVATFLDQANQVQSISGVPTLATLLVLLAPRLHIAFGAPSVPVGATTTLRFKLRNSAFNPVPLTGVSFVDRLPANLTVASPSFPENTCGGTWQATPGSSEVALIGAAIAPGVECSLTVEVTATSEGLANDVGGPVLSDNGGAGNSAQDSLVVIRAPLMSIQVRPQWVYSGNTARVQFTITNPNLAASLNVLVFYVHLSPKLTVAGDPNVVTNCEGGSLTANPGETTMRFLNGVVPAGSSCQIAVTLRANGLGVERIETTRIAAIGTVPGSRATARLTVVQCPAASPRTSHRRRRSHRTRVAV